MITNNRLSQQQYEQNFADIHPPFENQDAAIVEANRCIFCYDAPCMKSCPTSINIPKFIKQIATDDTKGSARTILSSNIFGAGCGKVCPVEKLCEGACVYNFLEETPIAIAKLQRFSTEKAINENWTLFTRKPSVGKRVAVVGAGPAGLACAHALSRQGVDVTVYEKERKGGGLMTYGIAAYKVTPQFCEDEVNYILSIGGIEVKYNQELGKTVMLADLQKNYDAVFLGVGVGLTRNLLIEGEQLHGVVDAIDFIYQLRQNGYNQLPVGDKVVVIGLGMTAIDAATQARRLGAAEVTIVYRRTHAEMPCTQHEMDIALLDGCQIEWLAAPKEVTGTDGNVSGLICTRMKLGQPDASGRRSPVETDETFTLQADMVIKATGQIPFIEMVQSSGLEHNNGKINIAENKATNIPNIFAGGDAVNGGKEVVDAVQAGKDAAKGILEYLGLSAEEVEPVYGKTTVAV